MSIFPSNNYYLIITLLSIVALLNTLPISTSTNDTSDIDLASHHQLSDALHDLLSENGFPKGLVPDAVESYTLAGDGTFQIRLKTNQCYVQFTDFFYYDRTIAGKLSYGRIADLSGIQVRKHVVWLPITDIWVDGQTIQLMTGFLAETVPVSMFETIRSCENIGGRKGLLAHQQVRDILCPSINYYSLNFPTNYAGACLYLTSWYLAQ